MWSHGPFSGVNNTNYAGIRDQNVTSGYQGTENGENLKGTERDTLKNNKQTNKNTVAAKAKHTGGHHGN